MSNANDLFISYAWSDNEPPTGALSPESERWVWMFHDALLVALNKPRPGIPPKVWNVWIDKSNIRANHRVQAVLDEQVKSSALLLVLMSSAWKQSSWCAAELATFVDHHPGTDTQAGVILVDIEPVAREERPDSLRELDGFKFHRKLAQGGGSVPLGYPLPSPGKHPEFYVEILALAEHIRAARGSDEPSAKPTGPFPRERVVWIAEPTDDLQRRRRELRDAITQAGYSTVSPDLDQMRRSPDTGVEQQLESGLRSAGLYVHLLGPHAGRDIVEGQSWAQRQSDVAQRIATAEGWPYVAWRDVGTPVAEADAAHQPLLLKAIEQGFEEFRRDVVARLPTSRVVAARPPDREVSICVTLSEEDERLGDEVRRMLEQLDVFYMSFINRVGATQDPGGEDRALAQSNGVVIVYGAADGNWMVTKVWKANGLRGRRKQTWGALVDAPVPGKGPTPQARAIELHDWSGGPNFDRMKQFVVTVGAQCHV